MINKNYFLAKSNKVKNEEFITQTIEEHTNKLIELFNKFKEVYGKYFEKHELELIKIACETHDLGKMNSRFQKKLYKSINKEKLFECDKYIEGLYKNINIKEIPHGILSCSFLNIDELEDRFGTDYTEAVVSAVYNHHQRDFSDIKNKDIKEVVNKDLKKYADMYDKNLQCDSFSIQMNVIKEGVDNDYEFWLKFIVIKGMLNKMDYAASVCVYNKEKRIYEFGINKDDFEMKADNSCEKVITKFKQKKYELKDCQKFMKDNKDKNIIVVASTGIGKTEGALLWAGDSKTFYTLPIKVSINAIYERIKTQNYYDKEKITILHSDAVSELMKEDSDFEDAMEKYGKSKKLSYPFTVCTIDQLFYFVFKSLGTEIFPATLKYSKIIIDEIQSYTPEITAFILYGLKVINDLGGQFCIMTATLPPIIKELMERENIKFETPKTFIKKDENGNSIKRHFIKFIEFKDEEEKDFNYNEILKKAKNNKVLIICNTVKRSQDVYIKLKEQNEENVEINLLHSRFIFRDRKLKEEKIQDFASTKEEKRNNDAGIWISTQIVEASLDIDFDILYTDMCSADSLLQRMGRCYRDRVYTEYEPNIFIYDTKVGVGTVYDKDIFKFSVEHIQEYNNKIFTEEDKQDYINKVYDIEKLKNIDNENSYYKTIKKNIKDLEIFPIGGIDKGTAEEQFRNIQNITVIPRIFYNELNKKNIFQKYEEAFGEDKIDIIDEIMDYTLSAPLYFEKYCIKEIKNKGLEHIFISNLKYDKELGLIKELDEKLEFENRCI
ncbi:CRISPR-associated helicase Cas3' [uncultured Brachyspira sp.]|uniref:CRISPR-associated helicase Cas3' n=1 Tax=uncultured Brachyspira sp. TaxID=221953 RepID=UPI00259BEDEB|nr:CRISPR-associated helicase Cas3' [uncultured Brachyspira sp.]